MAGDDDEASAVNRPGGVKALLQQLNNKFSDSHVKLPDGTVPTPAKKNTFVKRSDLPAREIGQPAASQQQGSAEGGDASPPKGVRAMLQREVKSSFVKLPDGSTIKNVPPPATKKAAAPAPAAVDDDYEPAPLHLPNLQEDAAAPLHLPDLNLQEHVDEYEKGSRSAPQLLHSAPTPNAKAFPRSTPRQPSPPILSDYPAQPDQGSTGRRTREQSPPVLSDYPQPSRSVPREQPLQPSRSLQREYPPREQTPPEMLRSGARSFRDGANRGAAPQGHHGGPQHNSSGYIAGPPGVVGRHQDDERRGPAAGRGGGGAGQNMGGPPQPRHAPPNRQREQMRPEDVYNARTYQNGVSLGTGRDTVAREPVREPTRREAKSREKDTNRERDVGNREHMPREQEPFAREQRARESREPMARESRSREERSARELISISRDPIGRDGVGHHVLPPAPPALLHGQMAKPQNARPGGPVLPHPPNLLPSAKLHEFPNPQRSGPPPPVKPRSPSEQEQANETYPRQSKVSEWVQAIPPSATKSSPTSPRMVSREREFSPRLVPREREVQRQKPQQMHMPAESLPLMRQSPPMPTLQALNHEQKSPKPTPPASPLDSALTPRDFAEMAVGQMALSDSGALSIRAIVPSRPVANRCGIGVNFKRLESRSFEVVSLVPGGMGAESGLIFVGDVLRFVDGNDVTKITMQEFEELLLGEDGTTVTLSFGKPGSTTSALVHVAVNRGPEGISSESSLSSMPTAVHAVVDHTPSFISPAPAPVTPAKVPVSSVPRVLVPKVIHANPVAMQRFPSNRSDGVMRNDANVSSSTDNPEKLVGVGIVFHVDEHGGLRVKHLIPGGPAAISQEVVMGDVLCEIDGLDVYRKSVDEIQDHVMGPKDSVVKLGLRNPANISGPVKQVHLFRRFDASSVKAAPPPPAPLSYSKVIEMLYVGDSEISRNIGLMKDLDINCVVNVAFECDNLFEADFTYSNFPFEDHPSSILTSGFDDACETIARHMHLSLTSIVHCSDGNNRSAAFCIAYLMRKKRATLKQAWNLVKNVRPTVNLYQEYFQQLLWYERQVHGSNTMSESDIPSFAQMHRTVG